MQKAIDDYKKKFWKTNKEIFWLSDMIQIKEISKGDYWDTLQNALISGFMIGYRTAKREAKKK